MTSGLRIAIAAGGTGGHMIPAHALSEELQRRGHTILLLTDTRGQRFPGLFKGVLSVRVDSATPASAGLFGRLKMIPQILSGIHKSRVVLAEFSPHMTIGFGGYPAFPSIVAALLGGFPYALHEQNAVLGRVNRLLARGAKLLALSFPNTTRVPANVREVSVTGNPVRDEILKLVDIEYRAGENGSPIHLLVVGGSQGASILSRVAPHAVANLPDEIRDRVTVTQQCRAEDQALVANLYHQAGVSAEVAPYFEDMATCLSTAHLVIARAGASTVAELAISGRPAILVPFAAAMDDHQAANARELVLAGGAWMMREADFTSDALRSELVHIFATHGALSTAATRTRELARPQAANELANRLEGLVPANARNAERPHQSSEDEPSVLRRVQA